MEVDPTRVCELLVGLPDVNVLGVIDDPGGALRVVIETREPRPACAGCAGAAQIKDRPVVELVDLAASGRPVRLVWRKHRWECANEDVSAGVVDGCRRADRVGACSDDGSGGTVGDPPGRGAWPHGERTRGRTRVCVAHGQRRGDRLWRSTR